MFGRETGLTASPAIRLHDHVASYKHILQHTHFAEHVQCNGYSAVLCMAKDPDAAEWSPWTLARSCGQVDLDSWIP